MQQALIIILGVAAILCVLAVWSAHSAVVRAQNAHIADLQRQIAWLQDEGDDDDEGDDCGVPPWVGERPTLLVSPN